MARPLGYAVVIVVERRVQLTAGYLALRIEIPDDAVEMGDREAALITGLLGSIAKFTGHGAVIVWTDHDREAP